METTMPQEREEAAVLADATRGTSVWGEARVPRAAWSADELGEFLACRAALCNLCWHVFDPKSRPGMTDAVLDASRQDACWRFDRLYEARMASGVSGPASAAGPTGLAGAAAPVRPGERPDCLDKLLAQAAWAIAGSARACETRGERGWDGGARTKYAALGGNGATQTGDDDSFAVYLGFVDSLAYEALTVYRAGDANRARRIVALQVGFERGRMGRLADRMAERLAVTQPGGSPYVPLAALASEFFRRDAELGESLGIEGDFSEN